MPIKFAHPKILKNKTRQAKFTAVGCPPQPVVTRWGSRFNAVIYYAKNFVEVKAIKKSVEGSGI